MTRANDVIAAPNLPVCNAERRRCNDRVYVAVTMLVLAMLAGCAASKPKIPARIIGATGDTVIINERQPGRIPVHVLTADGDTLPDSTVRFTLVDATAPAVSETGVVQCVHSQDFRVRAAIAALHTTIVVRCRPVKKVYIAGPMQFLLPDTGQDMRITAVDLDGKPVDVMKGKTSISDSSVATINDLRVTPRSPGAAIAGARFGNQSAGVGVHVYERATSLDPLFDGKNFIGIQLRLSGGEFRTWRLPEGTWMLTMLPEDDESGLAIRVDGATCSQILLTRRRLGCFVKKSATVTVYNRSASPDSPDNAGSLLVRRINS